jgi:hypothetical protein
MGVRLFFIAVATILLSSCNSDNALEKEPFPLGAGIEDAHDWSRSNIFIDLIHTARDFSPPDTPWETTNPVPIDENGWPTEDFGMWVLALPNIDFSGTYKLYFDGQADVSCWHDPSTIENLVYDPLTNKTTADVVVPLSNDLALSFVNTSYGPGVNGVKNIVLLRPGYTLQQATEQVFTNQFINHVKRFSILRTMDFTKTNGQEEGTWSTRSKVTDARYSTEKGVPWEMVIKLANVTGKDIWINIPHKADENYITNLAALFASNLHGNSKVYTEYSNEVWNFGFPQATWNFNQASLEVAAGGSNLDVNAPGDDQRWARRRVAKQNLLIGNAFKQAFSIFGTSNRIRPVLSGQFVAPGSIADGLDFINEQYPESASNMYCVGIAPYISSSEADASETATVDDILSAFRASLQWTIGLFPQYQALSETYKIKVCGYEIGLDTYGARNIAAKKAAMHDSRTADIVYDYLHGWFDAGFSSASWYFAGASNWDDYWGSWGLTEDMNNQNTPKINGIDRFLSEQ